jgi:peptide/nickel transport system substrate-binding protein
MTTSRRSLLAAGAAGGFASWVAPGPGALAQSPPGVIVMAKQIDDIISLDPAEVFEFSGSEIVGQVYDRLIHFVSRKVNLIFSNQ